MHGPEPADPGPQRGAVKACGAALSTLLALALVLCPGAGEHQHGGHRRRVQESWGTEESVVEAETPGDVGADQAGICVLPKLGFCESNLPSSSLYVITGARAPSICDIPFVVALPSAFLDSGIRFAENSKIPTYALFLTSI